MQNVNLVTSVNLSQITGEVKHTYVHVYIHTHIYMYICVYLLLTIWVSYSIDYIVIITHPFLQLGSLFVIDS